MPKRSEEQTISKTSYRNVITACIVAAGMRYYLMTSKYQSIIANHVEVSTPLNSWKRVLEGLFLKSKNIDPYYGDLLHETPLLLNFYKFLLNIFHNETAYMMLTFDLITSLLLFFMGKKHLQEIFKQECKRKDYPKGAEEALLKENEVIKAPFYVLLAYLFNPFTLLSCIGYSTTVFHSFFLSAMLFSLVYGFILPCSIFLAISSSISFYPLFLIFPVFIYVKKVHQSATKAVMALVLFITTLLLITAFNSNNGTDFSYIKNVYGCILTVPDLQPNIGLFWYFFTEMFDHFRELFIYAFQINATILYLLPLSIKLRNQPLLLTVAIIFIVTIFKSYPSTGDVGFVLSLLPNFIYLFSYTQQSFLVGIILLISSTLGPVVWYLWIYCNSANANFYFGVTLAFAIGLIFLLTDLLFAQVKREFVLKHGTEKQLKGGEGMLSLE